MRPTLLFLHGWGFDFTVWRDVAARLDGYPMAFAERGYFGAVGDAMPEGPVLAVAHSFGTMRLLADVPARCIGLVAVNGFDRFAAAPETPGVPVRVIERMQARLAEDAARTLADFRARCGTEEPAGGIVGEALERDLRALRHDDLRAEAGRLAAPVLSLQGALDPVLPPAMRDVVLAEAARIERRTIADGGHLLPLTHPDACADAVRAMAERVR
ncbi:alpha/beta fold hydrolase [Croceicoccus sp. BE223]|uniref:alpha/beta fold hydrolase n=1 Tax=Croceicoccus sp. BE223 TaxID=2817716 RepID=UPI002863EDA3|nr:alpha/beta fold hydrolase [Croceicoccus sp. BE223]MDR7101722.1 pimeloyl-[acyl-carrier protein] methyl ester esterase [Croceicoccus sp. BE223]